MDRKIKLEAADIMQDKGISLPLHILGKITLRIKVKPPSMDGVISISRMYEQLGVTAEEYASYNTSQKHRFVVAHGSELTRMVAYGIARSPLTGWISNRIIAWLMRKFMLPMDICAIWDIMTGYIDTIPFGDTIRSAQRINRLEPMSQQQKRS